MHIAICDDNIADRKQLERLLGRESDRRSSVSGVLYVDSYGDPETMLATPMQYDAFFIDMCQGPVTGMQVLTSLMAAGVTAPIIMCSSRITYEDTPIPDANILYLPKPVVTVQLRKCLDTALAFKEAAVSRIELRNDSSTYYVAEEEILYAISEGRHTQIQLSGNRTIEVLDTIENLFTLLEVYPSFFISTQKALVNGRHIASLSLLSLTMSDGRKIPLSPACRDYAKYAFTNFTTDN